VAVRLLVLFDEPADGAAFELHHREVHLPLARRLTGLTRLAVSARTAAVQGEPVHLVEELEWGDLDALRAAFASQAGRELAADTADLGAAGVRSTIYEVTDLL
jgi:uncharacterized protein (TIGR02118 family)